MRDPIDAAADANALRAPQRTRSKPLIQVAPGPEEPDLRDKAGRQHGMIIALAGAGAFWAAVGAAAAYFLNG
jgi:hypothetical protein